ncbi:hypothetical protein C8R43DRAFT_1136775 [Mycena crocata]|nr:hypothetical protein C8R43DRAFT_1136775 [Mycena crocata]
MRFDLSHAFATDLAICHSDRDVILVKMTPATSEDRHVPLPVHSVPLVHTPLPLAHYRVTAATNPESIVPTDSLRATRPSNRPHYPIPSEPHCPQTAHTRPPFRSPPCPTAHKPPTCALHSDPLRATPPTNRPHAPPVPIPSVPHRPQTAHTRPPFRSPPSHTAHKPPHAPLRAICPVPSVI